MLGDLLMIENSLAINIIMRIWNKFLYFYGYSGLSKIAASFIRIVLIVWNGSFIRHILYSDFHYDEKIKHSFIGGAMFRLSEYFRINGDKNSKFIKSSQIVSFFRDFCDSLLYIKVRDYGITLILFGLPTSVARLLMSELNIIFYSAVLSVVVGVILFIINRPISDLFNGSFLCVWFGGLFEFPEIKEKSSCEKKYTVFFAFLGIFLSFCAIFLSTEIFVLVAGGLIGGILVLYRTEIGVFTAAFLIPLVPTKIIIGLTAMTVVSYLFHLMAGRLKYKFHLLDFFVMMFAFMLAYSVFISFKPFDSMFMVSIYLLFIAFYFAAKNSIVERKQLFAIISLIVFSGFIVSLLGVYQNITGAFEGRDMWLDTAMFSNVGARVYSTLENPNVLGEFLIIIISLTTAMLYYYKQPFYKAAATVVLIVSSYCMVLTLSRGAWLGLIFAFAVFIMLNDRKLLWLAIIFVIIAPVIVPDSILARFLSIGNIRDTSTNYRVNIWLASLLMVRIFWPIGIGLGTQTFVFIYSKFAFNAVYSPHSHNLFLQIIIDLGIFGLLVFIGYVSVFFKNLIISQKYVQKTDDTFLKMITGALCAALAGYLLQGVTDHVWYNYRIVCLFWLVLALSGSIYAMISEDRLKNNSLQAVERQKNIKTRKRGENW